MVKFGYGAWYCGVLLVVMVMVDLCHFGLFWVLSEPGSWNSAIGFLSQGVALSSLSSAL